MAYIESILLGFSLATIPGPIFFEVTRRTLAKGFWSGSLLSVGEFLANFGMMMIVFFGLSEFLLLKPVKSVLFLLGFAVLFWTGISAVRMNKEDIGRSSVKKTRYGNSVAVGFALALNPIAAIVWVSVGGAYLAQYASRTAAFFNIFLLAFGVMLFFFVLAIAIHVTRHKISMRYVLLFSRVFGTLLLGYGTYFLYQFIALAFS